MPGLTPMPHVDGIRHREVEAAGIRFHVAEAGDGDPVLLLHGWPQHWFAWRKVALLLATDHRVICPDLRGFGWSDAPSGAYDKQTLAEDVLALLDALELDRVDLIAHDWGAWVGFLLCLDHPDRISHYLALNMVTPWPDPPSAGAALGLVRLWYQAALATPGLGRALIEHTDFVRRLITAGAVHRDAWAEEDLESFAAVLREPSRANASVHLYRTFLLRELRPSVAGQYRGRRLAVPTVLLHGKRDLALDHRHLGAWKRWADDMALELRDDSGHFIAEELPDLVANRARALFRGESPSAVAAGESRAAERSRSRGRAPNP
jgi:pimeloyl-ACP methyl ester carboxylesterase